VKFILISDLHGTDRIPVARKDNLFETFKRKFEFILGYARKHKCKILQAGDMSDSSRNWNILNYYMDRLEEYGIAFYSVFGQHDLYHRGKALDTPSTMLALIKAGLVGPLGDKAEVFENDIFVYGASWGDEIPRGVIGGKNILVLHAPIAKSALWCGHSYINPLRFLKDNIDFDVVLAGDIHRRFKIKENGRYILNTGPVLRLEANQYNLIHKPSFYVLDTESWRVHTVVIPHEPAEDVLTREHIDKKKVSKEELEEFSNELKTLRPLRSLRRKQILSYLRKKVSNKDVRKVIMEVMDADKPVYNGIKEKSTGSRNSYRNT